jgi:hypothetical protein
MNYRGLGLSVELGVLSLCHEKHGFQKHGSPSMLNPTADLQTTLKEFENSLPAQQRDQPRVFIATNPTSPETNAVLLFTAQVDQANASRRSHCVASRIHGLQFSGVVDTFVSANP